MIDEPTLFDEPTGPVGPVVRVAVLVAYVGTGFRGLAPNPGVRTVVGEIQAVVRPYVGDLDVTMSGRTDAGVHGWGQVLSFEVPESTDIDRLIRIVNRSLAPEVVVRSVATVAPSFDARRDATGRSYRYHVECGPAPDPFAAPTTWWVSTPLDLPAMRLAAAAMLGEHDFSSFCRRPKGVNVVGEPHSLVRNLHTAQWSELADGRLRFTVEGSAFCHQMVRSLTAFCVAVGKGKRSAGEVRAVIAAQDRSAAEPPAPAHGLTLWSVQYPADPFADADSAPPAAVGNAKGAP